MTVQYIIEQLDRLLEKGIQVGVERQKLAEYVDKFGTLEARTLLQSYVLDDLVAQYTEQREMFIFITVQLVDEYINITSTLAPAYPKNGTSDA